MLLKFTLVSLSKILFFCLIWYTIYILLTVYTIFTLLYLFKLNFHNLVQNESHHLYAGQPSYGTKLNSEGVNVQC